MALTQKIASIRSDFNAGTVPFAAEVAAWFAAHPGIVVQSIGYSQPDPPYFSAQVIRIAYLEADGLSIGGTWEALLYQSSNVSPYLTAQDAFNADFVSGSALPMVPMFMVDITDHERARTGPDSLLIIGMRTDVGPLGQVGYDRAVYIASPVFVNIAAGATGTCLLLDASGAAMSLAIPLTNVGDVAWVVGQRNYAVYDELTGVYMGIPSCGGAGAWNAPASTTTTGFSAPANFPEPSPTTSLDQPTTSSSTTSSTTTTAGP